MPIKVACACGKKLAVKDEHAGKKVKCPACQKLLSIPKPKVVEKWPDDEWDLGDSAEEDFDDEPAEAPTKSRGGKSSATRGAASRKSSVKGKGKKPKSSNRGLLIGVLAGGGLLVVALLTWMLFDDKFDYKAWERVQPTLRPLGIQGQLLKRREYPESIPEELQVVARLDLTALNASERYPDNILSTIKSLSHVVVHTREMNDAKLNQLSEHPGLIGLHLRSKSDITADGLRTLKRCPLFSHLYLEQVSLNSELMSVIGEFRNLRCLSLNDMPVTDDLLSNLLSLNELDCLVLRNTSVTDAGTAQLAKLSSLTILYLDGSKVTDQGLPSLKSLSKLRFLRLRGLNVSPQAVDELQKALPGCKILLK